MLTKEEWLNKKLKEFKENDVDTLFKQLLLTTEVLQLLVDNPDNNIYLAKGTVLHNRILLDKILVDKLNEKINDKSML